MKSTEHIITMFRNNGLKITPQRRAIIDLLTQDNTHPTVNDIFQRASAVMPDISLTTIYNTLNELIALGELTEVTGMCENGLRYDTNAEPHHHLFCVDCHTLIDIDRDYRHLELSKNDSHGYHVFKHQVTFYGRCPACMHQQDTSQYP